MEEQWAEQGHGGQPIREVKHILTSKMMSVRNWTMWCGHHGLKFMTETKCY